MKAKNEPLRSPPFSSSYSDPPLPLFYPTPLSPSYPARALHDSLMVVKRMLESNILVAGGGAVETALSIYLESFATTLGSREQLAIAEFAEALLVIPKTLAVNAAQVCRVADDDRLQQSPAPARTAAVGCWGDCCGI